MSLRNKLIRLAHANPEFRGDLLPLLKTGRSEKYPMGMWQGQEYAWPNPGRNWSVSDYDQDTFGDYYKIQWQWVGSPSMILFVAFDASPLIRSGGKRPATYLAQGVGQTMTGKWSQPGDVRKILDATGKWSKKLLQKLQAEIRKLSNSNWDVTYDGYSISATYIGPKSPSSDATMTVTFDDVEDALIQQGRSTANIFFSAESDYQGSHGIEEEQKFYGSISDIKKILSQAQRLFRKWDV